MSALPNPAPEKQRLLPLSLAAAAVALAISVVWAMRWFERASPLVALALFGSLGLLLVRIVGEIVVNALGEVAYGVVSQRGRWFQRSFLAAYVLLVIGLAAWGLNR